MEESAEGVEVVAREEKPVRPDVDAVVHRGLDDVPSGLERGDRKLGVVSRRHADVDHVDVSLLDELHRIVVDRNALHIKPELRPQPRAVDNQPRGGDVPVQLERAAVEAGPLFHEPLRHHVKAAGHSHRVRRGKVRGKRLFSGLPFLEAELPASVQRNVREKSYRRTRDEPNH